jgi:hypothetical protein
MKRCAVVERFGDFSYIIVPLFGNSVKKRNGVQ